ncbi:MAG: TetR/AcrR family transcriptional regulator [Acinetobacter populi]|uniref:TetR/AcrR family transcriptional regulator n=1 Tax=Acinetobacter populi TaxID=1582270 RepID=UPI002356F2F4|nr:TetR/AcrR family transcriptional regulator [Acinetobacter populi]MCH4247775.1 TetR/AcrR family transcriptional regulator [Acinetobacter populi]
MKSSTIKQSPCTQRGVDRCSLLFEVATDLFLRYGYEKVSLDQIVEHAGGSKATIYKYFGSKKGLFIAICQERCNKFTHQIELACQRNSVDIRQNLSELLFDLYSIFADDKSTAFGRLILLVAQNDQDLAQQLYSFGPKRAHQLLAELLQQAHECNQLYCTRPLDSAIYFLGFFHDIHWRTMVGLPFSERDMNIKDHINYIVDRFIEGHQNPEKMQ